MFTTISRITLLTVLTLVLPVLSLDSTSIRPRSVYQVITDRFALPPNSSSSSTTCNTSDRRYCGGTWSGISSKLDYIKGMGFDTIWISPVVSNIGGTTGEGEAYHGYWTLDPGSLNDNFGTEEDLKSLIGKVHEMGMYIMVDVVVNHVAATSSSTFSPSSAYGPFSTTDDYHPFCWVTDYTNQTNVEQCWLGDTSVALPDLNTESTKVRTYWTNWITQLVTNYTIDAIRIDTVKHISHDFWPGFTTAAGVFNQGEVLDGDARYTGNYQSNGSVNPFNYPVYYPLVQAFVGNASMQAVVDVVGQVRGNFTDSGLAGVFIDNHDNPRFESYTQDSARIRNAQAYPLVSDGIPYVYYGSEAGFSGGADPANREALWTSSYNTSSDMYQLFKRLNAARQAAGNASSSFYTSQMTITAPSSTDLIIAKPPLISLLTNRGSSSPATNITIPSATSGWTSGITVIDAVSCSSFLTESNGDLIATINAGGPRVFIAASQRGELCAVTLPNGNSSTTTESTGGSGIGVDVRNGWVVFVLGVMGVGMAML